MREICMNELSGSFLEIKQEIWDFKVKIGV